MSVRIKWNLKGFDELRTAPGVRADLNRRAEALAAACGDGFEALPELNLHTRAHRVVAATTVKAARQDRKRNILLSNLDSAR